MHSPITSIDTYHLMVADEAFCLPKQDAGPVELAVSAQ